MDVRSILFAAVMLFIATLAFIGNLVVILAVFSHRRLQNPANYLIANLALSDFLQAAISMPMRIAEALNTSDETLIRCDLVISMSILFYGASNANLALIAIDRYVAISKPLSYTNIVKTSSYKIVIVITWIFLLIISLSPVVGWRRSDVDSSVGSVCRYGTTLTEEYLILFVILIDLVPFVIMVFTYTYIFNTTRKQIRQIRAQEIAVTTAAINLAYTEPNSASQSDSEAIADTCTSGAPNADAATAAPQCSGENETMPANNNKEDVPVKEVRKGSMAIAATKDTKKVPLSTIRTRKATRTVLAIIGFFFVFCIPITVIDAIEFWCSTCGMVPHWVTTVALWMVSANTCVNVFVYGGFNKDYRKAYRKVWVGAKNGISGPFFRTIKWNESVRAESASTYHA